MPHNGSRISGEPSLKSLGESTAAGASPHELPYPEPEGRRIEGGGVRDGLVRGSSVCSRLLGSVDRGFAIARTLASLNVAQLDRRDCLSAGCESGF